MKGVYIFACRCSTAKLCPILCHPMDCSTPGFPVLHYLLEFAQIHVHLTMSFSVLPFSSCIQSFPASGFFPVSQFFVSGFQSMGVSASASVLPMYSGLISLSIDWFDLLAVQGTLQGLLQHHSFKSINSLALSLPYGSTLISIHDY